VKRLFWLLVLAGAVWTVVEVRAHGWSGAFGGVLAGRLEPLESAGEIPLPDNVLD
jgi:hypothetical protein